MRIFRRYANAHRMFEVVLEERVIRRKVGLVASWSDASLDTEHHRSPIAARAAYDAMCRVYTERAIPLVAEEIDETVAPVHVVDPTTVATDPELEAQCLASPDSPAPWSVYADWLMAAGDPRGPLAALHLAGKTTEAADYLSSHAEALLGGFADAVELTWRHGFAIGARIKVVERDDRTFELEESTAGFLALPIARFVRALRFGLADREVEANDWGPTLDAILAAPQAAQITELRFDDYSSDDNEISWTPFGDLTAIVGLPALEVLHIRSGLGGTLGPLALPALRKYVRISGGLDPRELTDLADSTLPGLEFLELWLGTPAYQGDVTVADLAPILAGTVVPALRHLGLVNTMLTDELVPALARSALLPRLATLDLSRGTMTAQGAAALVAHAVAFRHLTAVDLDDNHLTPAEVERVCAALPQVHSASQRDEERAGDGEAEAEVERFVALGE